MAVILIKITETNKMSIRSRSRRSSDDYALTGERESPSHQGYVKQLIIQNNEAVQKQKFRFDEVDYNFIWRMDIALCVLQLVISLIYMGSWFTLVLVRIPRVVISIFSQRCFFKIRDADRRISYLKFEWVARLVTNVLYVLLSIGWSVWLAGRFCEMFEGVFEHIRGRRVGHEYECQWQVFGFRLVFMILYYPLEYITFAVVRRHAMDMTF